MLKLAKTKNWRKEKALKKAKNRIFNKVPKNTSPQQLKSKKKKIIVKKKYGQHKIGLFKNLKFKYLFSSKSRIKKKPKQLQRNLVLKQKSHFDLFYNFYFLKKIINTILVKGLKKNTQNTLNKSFIFLKKHKKFSFILFFKLLILLRTPLYFKPVYRSGELFTVPAPLSYLKQWFICFKLLKKLEKSVRFGSFLKKLQGEYAYIYNDIFLNLPKIRQKMKIKNKKKKRTFLPFKNIKKVLPTSFLLSLYVSKNLSIVENSSYFHYRW